VKVQKTLKNITGKDIYFTFYEVIAARILVRGSENWTLNTSEGSIIETAEMSYLRNVC
jgi:hypothetical protein